MFESILELIQTFPVEIQIGIVIFILLSGTGTLILVLILLLRINVKFKDLEITTQFQDDKSSTIKKQKTTAKRKKR